MNEQTDRFIYGLTDSFSLRLFSLLTSLSFHYFLPSFHPFFLLSIHPTLLLPSQVIIFSFHLRVVFSFSSPPYFPPPSNSTEKAAQVAPEIEARSFLL